MRKSSFGRSISSALIVVASMIFSAAAGCSTPAPVALKIRRPNRPVLEKVASIEITIENATGATTTALVYEGEEAEKLQRNLERIGSYVRALEAAPFWEGR